MSDGESDWESGSEDEWLYMEDHFDEADELAEHQCPSPQPLEGVVPEYDAYEYFQDIEYLSDGGLNDQVVRRKKAVSTSGAIVVGTRKTKRKRGLTSSKTSRGTKRQKLALQDTAPKLRGQDNAEPIVVWISNSERDALLDDVPLLPLKSTTAVVTGTITPDKGQERNNLAPSKQRISDNGAKPQPSSPSSSSRPDSAIAGDGFDLGDISSIAGLLSAEHIESLKAILIAQGLNADALDAVLRDLLEGRDRQEEDDYEEDED